MWCTTPALLCRPTRRMGQTQGSPCHNATKIASSAADSHHWAGGCHWHQSQDAQVLQMISAPPGCSRTTALPHSPSHAKCGTVASQTAGKWPMGTSPGAAAVSSSPELMPPSIPTCRTSRIQSRISLPQPYMPDSGSTTTNRTSQLWHSRKRRIGSMMIAASVTGALNCAIGSRQNNPFERCLPTGLFG